MIQKLTKKHIENLTEVDFHSAHPGNIINGISKKHMKEKIKDRFVKGYEIFFGYVEGDEILGYATLKPFFPGFNHCELHWIAVHKIYQRKGIGTILVKKISDYAAESGFRKIFVYTGKTNNIARSFYEKLKFKEINQFPDYYGYKKGDTIAVLYGKPL